MARLTYVGCNLEELGVATESALLFTLNDGVYMLPHHAFGLRRGVKIGDELRPGDAASKAFAAVVLDDDDDINNNVDDHAVAVINDGQVDGLSSLSGDESGTTSYVAV